MTSSVNKDFQFFRDAVHVFSSSLILQEVMRAAFDFMDQHFPLEGLSLHRFESKSKSMHYLFLVTQDKFYSLDIKIPFPERAVTGLERIEQTYKVINVPHSNVHIIPTLHGKAIASYLPDKDRARLVAILSTPQKKIVGHLSLVGPCPECFAKEHEHKLDILWPVLGMFMMNLRQYHEISELQNQLADRNRYLAGRLRFFEKNVLIGEESGLRFIKEMITQLSGLDVPVLITGETGTGKELIADAIQRTSIRHEAPYIKVNCGAIPDSLIDSELFGHEKGAFTGADRKRQGRFEQADGGTLFLDEVGDMPLNAQIRLLRVLQDGIFERIGGSRPIRANVRIIAATHQDLLNLVKIGKFREDLYYRLNVFPIHVPPLRERAQDIPALVHHFIAKKAGQLGLSEAPLLAQDALPVLMAHSWPGNVRELENLVERALAINPKGPLRPNQYLRGNGGQPVPAKGPEGRPFYYEYNNREDLAGESNDNPIGQDIPESVIKIRETIPSLDQVMSEHIRKALVLCNGRISGPRGAARMLGINPNTLRKRMDRHGIPYGRKEI